jgi:hypothetical protein
MSSKRRTITWVATLMAGAAILAGSTPLVGQVVPSTKKPVATDTSSKRIKIQKETSGGEVCLPPKCTPSQPVIEAPVRDASYEQLQWARAAQRTLDSIEAEARLQREIARMQNEAIALRERSRLDSIARAEAAEREAQLAMKRHLARGFYFGLAGGASMPQRNIRDGYTGGWNVTVPVGWDANDSRLGFRTDFAIDHMNGTQIQNPQLLTMAASGDITVWSLNADVKIRAHAPRSTSRTNLYALAGIGAHRVVNGVYGTLGPNAGQNLAFNDAKTNFGWNVGAGLSVAWGPTELFVESRFFQVKSDLAYHMNNGIGTYTSFTPIVVGLTWF